MNEATWIIILGLVFDICGAFFVVKTFLQLKEIPRTSGLSGYLPDDVKLFSSLRHDAWIGFILLCLGFTLQIIGSWQQNPPI